MWSGTCIINLRPFAMPSAYPPCCSGSFGACHNSGLQTSPRLAKAVGRSRYNRAEEGCNIASSVSSGSTEAQSQGKSRTRRPTE